MVTFSLYIFELFQNTCAFKIEQFSSGLRTNPLGNPVRVKAAFNAAGNVPTNIALKMKWALFYGSPASSTRLSRDTLYKSNKSLGATAACVNLAIEG